MSYLEEAAKLLHAATYTADADEYASTEERYSRRIQLAGEFAKLAAIERGQIPAELLGEVVTAVMDRRGA
jgi:hypothetical protein